MVDLGKYLDRLPFGRLPGGAWRLWFPTVSSVGGITEVLYPVLNKGRIEAVSGYGPTYESAVRDMKQNALTMVFE